MLERWRMKPHRLESPKQFSLPRIAFLPGVFFSFGRCLEESRTSRSVSWVEAALTDVSVVASLFLSFKWTFMMGHPRWDPLRRHYKKDTRFLLDLYTLTYDSNETITSHDIQVETSLDCELFFFSSVLVVKVSSKGCRGPHYQNWISIFCRL